MLIDRESNDLIGHVLGYIDAGRRGIARGDDLTGMCGQHIHTAPILVK